MRAGEALFERVSVDPKVCFGKPVIKGTRIWVSLILDRMAGGMTGKDILEEYPQLKSEDLRAALAYAEGGRASIPSRKIPPMA